MIPLLISGVCLRVTSGHEISSTVDVSKVVVAEAGDVLEIISLELLFSLLVEFDDGWIRFNDFLHLPGIIARVVDPASDPEELLGLGSHTTLAEGCACLIVTSSADTGCLDSGHRCCPGMSRTHVIQLAVNALIFDVLGLDL